MSRRRRMVGVMAMVLSAGVLASACQPSDVYGLPRAKAGARCTKVGGFARDATNVLQCNGKKRWGVSMPISRAVALIDVYNRSITPGSISRSGAGQLRAGSAVTTDLRVQVFSVAGSPMKGAVVHFSQSGNPVNWATSPDVATGVDGAATVTLQGGTTIGNTQVVASVVGSTVSTPFSVDTLAGEPAAFTVVGPDAVTLPLGASTTLRARLTDQFGNPVAREAVDVVTDNEELSFDSTLGAGQPEVTDGNGEYAVYVHATGLAGAFGVGFVAGPGLGLEADWDINVPAGPPYGIHLTDMSVSAPVNTTFPNPVVATVTDISGNPVAGATVSFVIDPSSAIVPSLSVASAVTDADGKVTTSVTCGSTVGTFFVRGNVGVGIQAFVMLSCS